MIVEREKFDLTLLIKIDNDSTVTAMSVSLTMELSHCMEQYLLWWLGVGGKGRTLSGGHRRATSTVAGNGIDVPFGPGFPYGAGNCLFYERNKMENRVININNLAQHFVS